MDFETLLDSVSGKLKGMAHRYRGCGYAIDRDDLYQEACVHLWMRYKDGLPSGINEAYAVKGCEYYLLNYLRKNREKAAMLSLEEPVEGTDVTRKELLPDSREGIDVSLDRKAVMDGVREGRFSTRERDVFCFLLDGYTVREIGKKLGISHVLVVRVKQEIIKKCHRTGKIKVTR